MANERNPNDPYRGILRRSLSRQSRGSMTSTAAQPVWTMNCRPDPELAEGPASGGRIAMFAVAIAVVLGAVFYGLNNSSINQAGTSSTAQNTAQAPPPAAPAGHA